MFTRRVMASLVVVMIAGACTGSSDEPKADPSPSPSPSTAAKPNFVALRDGKTFGTLNIRRGILNPFREIEVDQIAISPDGKTIVYVADSDPAKAQDGVLGAPLLRIGPLRNSGANDITIGAGTEPVFSPDGTQVAAVVPDRQDTCDPGQTGCPSETVVIYEAVAEPNEGTVVLEDGGWNIVGWTGSQLLAVSDDGSLWLAGEDGSGQISSDGSNVLAVSPTEPQALIAMRNQVAFLPLPDDPKDGGITADVAEIALDDSQVTGAFWSPDGSKVAVLTESKVFIIGAEGTDEPSAEEVSDSEGPTGQFAWGSDSEHFIFSKQQGNEERAMVCDPDLSCKHVFSWEKGITIQGLLNN
jgi:hypothetical protein